MNQFEFVQYESQPIEVEDPFQRLYDRNFEVQSFHEGITLVVTLVIVLGLWFSVAWSLPGKVGRKGVARWMWFGLLAFPYTMFFGLLVLTFSPWPVARGSKKETEELEKELESTKKQLEASQQRVERYTDYVTKANSVIEKLQAERMNHG
ncbi:hypothetical protein [Coleofasciculus sp. FACHB-1120]|uniref:hypothetical protein n=1 Tax=Coleofasciculus sp. FACHB-1120 TaxID=2692783 RepID=UPI0016828F50|nr:hypothetical protein [Coleofasciculus sp. FACHB-1120]MBD2743677.1 hypothetical protein [Coleofasciculus sp. FACHB-1120]